MLYNKLLYKMSYSGKTEENEMNKRRVISFLDDLSFVSFDREIVNEVINVFSDKYTEIVNDDIYLYTSEDQESEGGVDIYYLNDMTKRYITQLIFHFNENDVEMSAGFMSLNYKIFHTMFFKITKEQAFEYIKKFGFSGSKREGESGEEYEPGSKYGNSPEDLIEMVGG